MSGAERHAWETNIPRLLAEELLRDRGGSLSSDQLYQALVLTTGDRKAADMERSKRALEEMRKRNG